MDKTKLAIIWSIILISLLSFAFAQAAGFDSSNPNSWNYNDPNLYKQIDPNDPRLDYSRIPAGIWPTIMSRIGGPRVADIPASYFDPNIVQESELKYAKAIQISPKFEQFAKNLVFFDTIEIKKVFSEKFNADLDISKAKTVIYDSKSGKITGEFPSYNPRQYPESQFRQVIVDNTVKLIPIKKDEKTSKTKEDSEKAVTISGAEGFARNSDSSIEVTAKQGQDAIITGPQKGAMPLQDGAVIKFDSKGSIMANLNGNAQGTNAQISIEKDKVIQKTINGKFTKIDDAVLIESFDGKQSTFEDKENKIRISSVGYPLVIVPEGKTIHSDFSQAENIVSYGKGSLLVKGAADVRRDDLKVVSKVHNSLLQLKNGITTAIGKISFEDDGIYYEGLSDTSQLIRRFEGNNELVKIDGTSEGLVAKFTRKARVGDISQEGFFSGRTGIKTTVSNTNGRLNIGLNKESIAFLANAQNSPDKFVFIEKDLLMQLGEEKSYFGIASDLGIRYEPSQGNPVTFLSPKDVHAYLGEKETGAMLAMAVAASKSEYSQKGYTTGDVVAVSIEDKQVISKIISVDSGRISLDLDDDGKPDREILGDGSIQSGVPAGVLSERLAALNKRAEEAVRLLGNDEINYQGQRKGAEAALQKFYLARESNLPLIASGTGLASLETPGGTPLYYRTRAINGKEVVTAWSPDKENWMDLSTLTVSGGRWAGQKPTEANQQIIKSLAEMLGDYRVLQEEAQKNPSYRLTGSSLETGKYDDWHNNFKADNPRYPDMVQRSALQVAETYLKENNIDGALKFYQNAVEADPNSDLGKAAKKNMEIIESQRMVGMARLLASQQYAQESQRHRPRSVASGAEYYETLVGEGLVSRGYAGLSSLSPFNIARDLAKSASIAETERNKEIAVTSLQTIDRLIQNGHASNLKEAVDLMTIATSRMEDIRGEYLPELIGKADALKAKGFIPNVINPDYSRYLMEEPSIQAGIQMQAIPFNDPKRGSKMLQIAEDYRKKGNFEGAAMITRELSQASGDQSVRDKAYALYNEIVDPDGEWLNFADASLHSSTQLDIVAELANPFAWVTFGAAGKGTGLLLSKAPGGARVLSTTGKIINMPTNAIAGSSASALKGFAGQVVSIGVEEGAEYAAGVIAGPAAETFVMGLTGGADSLDVAQLAAKNAFKDAKIEVSPLVNIRCASPCRLAQVYEYDGIIDTAKLKGLGNIETKGGTIVFTNPKTGEVSVFARKGATPEPIEGDFVDSAKIKETVQAQAMLEEGNSLMQAAPVAEISKFNPNDIGTVSNFDDFYVYIRHQAERSPQGQIHGFGQSYDAERVIEAIERLRKYHEGKEIDPERLELALIYNEVPRAAGIQRKVEDLLLGRGLPDILKKVDYVSSAHSGERFEEVIPGKPVFVGDKPLINSHTSSQENMVIDISPGSNLWKAHQSIKLFSEKVEPKTEEEQLMIVYDFMRANVPYSSTMNEVMDSPKYPSYSLEARLEEALSAKSVEDIPVIDYTTMKQTVDIGETCLYRGGVCRHQGFMTAPILGRMRMDGVLKGYGTYNTGIRHGWSEYITPDGRRVVMDIAQDYMGPVRLAPGETPLRNGEIIPVDRHGYVLYVADFDADGKPIYFGYANSQIEGAINFPNLPRSEVLDAKPRPLVEVDEDEPPPPLESGPILHSGLEKSNPYIDSETAAQLSPQFNTLDIAKVEDFGQLQAYIKSIGYLDPEGKVRSNVGDFEPDEVINIINRIALDFRDGRLTQEQVGERLRRVPRAHGIREKVGDLLVGRSTSEGIVYYKIPLKDRLLGKTFNEIKRGEPIFPGKNPLVPQEPSSQEHMVVDMSPGSNLDRAFREIAEDVNEQGKYTEEERLTQVYDYIGRNTPYSLALHESMTAQTLGKKEFIDIGETCLYRGGVCRHTGFVTAPILGKMRMTGFLKGYGVYNSGPFHAWSEYITPEGKRIIMDNAQGYMGPIRIKSNQEAMRLPANGVLTDKDGYVLFYGGNDKAGNKLYYRYADLKIKGAVNE